MLNHLLSRPLLRYVVVAVIAFAVGSATIVTAAGSIKLFAISDDSGTNVAQVNQDGELLVKASGAVDVSFPATQDVSVTNFPAVQDVSVINPQTASLVPDALATVNIISKILNSTSNPDTVNPCQSDSTYVVPANKVLMITDMVAASGATIAIWTDIRKVIFELDTRAVSGLTASIQLQTPLKVDSGETVCPFLFGGGSAGFYSLISGQLVDSN